MGQYILFKYLFNRRFVVYQNFVYTNHGIRLRKKPVCSVVLQFYFYFFLYPTSFNALMIRLIWYKLKFSLISKTPRRKTQMNENYNWSGNVMCKTFLRSDLSWVSSTVLRFLLEIFLWYILPHIVFRSPFFTLGWDLSALYKI